MGTAYILNTAPVSIYAGEDAYKLTARDIYSWLCALQEFAHDLVTVDRSEDLFPDELPVNDWYDIPENRLSLHPYDEFMLEFHNMLANFDGVQDFNKFDRREIITLDDDNGRKHLCELLDCDELPAAIGKNFFYYSGGKFHLHLFRHLDDAGFMFNNIPNYIDKLIKDLEYDADLGYTYQPLEFYQDMLEMLYDCLPKRARNRVERLCQANFKDYITVCPFGSIKYTIVNKE